jgi:hypothetical protein
MIKVNLQKQPNLLVNLSLLIGALLFCLRWSFLPHSTQYTLLYSLNSLKAKSHNIFLDRGIFFVLLCFICFILLFLSFQVFLKGFKRHKYKAALPLVVNIVTLISLVLIHNIAVIQDYYAHEKDRGAVVSMIKAGELRQNDSQRVKSLDNLNHVLHKIYKVQLPSQYTHLSDGGDINIITDKNGQNKIIVFFNSIENANYTGWLYKINSITPIENYLFGVGNLKSYAWLLEAKQINDHWSWVDVIEN